MKKIIITLLLSCAVQIIVAQQQVSISETPTSEELRVAFSSAGSGAADPFIIIPEVVKKGNKAIPALEDLIFTTAGKDQKPEEVQRTALYAIMALEAIGTDTAYNVLFKTASTHSDPEVRGQSLKALAQSYYQKAQEDSVAPDKEVLHILLISVEDTTQTQYQNSSIAQIARDGIQNWLGQKAGEEINCSRADTVDVSLTRRNDFRKMQWQNMSEKLQRNRVNGLFEIKE